MDGERLGRTRHAPRDGLPHGDREGYVRGRRGNARAPSPSVSRLGLGHERCFLRGASFRGGNRIIGMRSIAGPTSYNDASRGRRDFRMSETSTALEERVREKDVAALSEFIERHRHALLEFVARRLGDVLRSKVEADDIVQETAAAALRCLPTANLADRDVFGWLCHLAEQRIVDAFRVHVRAQKRSAAREVRRPAPSGSSSTRMSFSQMLAASLTSPSQAVARDEQHRQLHAALLVLPAEQQTVLRLHFLEGRPSREIAQTLGKEDVTVRVMISRAVKKLRHLLGEAQ